MEKLHEEIKAITKRLQLLTKDKIQEEFLFDSVFDSFDDISACISLDENNSVQIAIDSWNGLLKTIESRTRPFQIVGSNNNVPGSFEVTSIDGISVSDIFYEEVEELKHRISELKKLLSIKKRFEIKGFRIPLNISVEQLGILIKVLYDADIIRQGTPITRITSAFSSIFKTDQSDITSANTLRKTFYFPPKKSLAFFQDESWPEMTTALGKIQPTD